MDCFPAAIVKGRAAPVILNPFAAMLTCVMVRADPPGLDMVTDWETVLPTATEPKFTVAGDTEIAAAAGVDKGLDGFAAPVTPIQPEIDRVAQSNRKGAVKRVRLRLFECVRDTRTSVRPCILPMNFIAGIVLCGWKTKLLYARTDEGQGMSLTMRIDDREKRYQFLAEKLKHPLSLGFLNPEGFFRNLTRLLPGVG
jgi:hypothetical protein